jgi:Tfp pilus assembly protein PilF
MLQKSIPEREGKVKNNFGAFDSNQVLSPLLRK